MASQNYSAVKVALVAAACTAALLFTLAPQQSTQQWTSTGTSRVAVPTYLQQAAKSELSRAMATPQQEVMPAVQSFQTISHVQPQGTSGQAVFTAGAFLFCSAAFALARSLMAPAQKQESVALLSATGEKKEDSRDMMKKMVEKLDVTDIQVLSRGGSMQDVAQSKGIDEIAQMIRADQASRKDLSPRDVVYEMQRGNGRFWMGLSERPDMSAMERRALIMAQAPTICVLSCSDSRVPVEIIFDQGLGEVFVVRMAGNILDETAEGSIEYAVKYLGVKVVLVIGHEGCGAVKGAITMSEADISLEPADLQTVLRSIKKSLNVEELSYISDGRSREREAIVQNTSTQVTRLNANPLLAKQVADGKLLVAGAFYEISSGIVDFFSLDKNGLVVDL